MKQLLAVLSYNLHYHAAYQEAFAIAERNKTDVLCFQECDANRLQNRRGDFSLACKTEERKLGLAIYYRKSRLSFIGSQSYCVKKSVYEKVFKWNCERLLVAKFYDKYLKKNIIIASLHLTHLVASNHLRRSQLENVFDILSEYENTPIVIAGDYNYPWFHEGLAKMVNQQGYGLYIPSDFTYVGRLKGNLILYRRRR
jgi:endonuclease/exonuclease/phosphatase family metal-dependent hydrolase